MGVTHFSVWYVLSPTFHPGTSFIINASSSSFSFSACKHLTKQEKPALVLKLIFLFYWWSSTTVTTVKMAWQSAHFITLLVSLFLRTTEATQVKSSYLKFNITDQHFCHNLTWKVIFCICPPPTPFTLRITIDPLWGRYRYFLEPYKKTKTR